MKYGIIEYNPLKKGRKSDKKKSALKPLVIVGLALAFIPTVFVRKEDGFDGYALLSRLECRKYIDDKGKTKRNIGYTIFYLGRFEKKK